MKILPVSFIVPFVVTPIVTIAVVFGFVTYRHHQERTKLLNQFSGINAPDHDGLVTDDALLKMYIATYGPAPTMQALVTATNHLGVECHNRAHQFGRFSYEEFGDEVLKLNLPECHSGFYHGAIEAYFRKNGTDKLKEKLSFICPPSLNLFFSHQCRHGLGHGLMAWSSYELQETLDYCGLIGDAGGQSSCRTGAFMENIVGSLTDSAEARALGHFTKFLSNDPQYPCSIVKEEYKSDCYFLQTDRMMSLAGGNPQGIVSGCEQAPVQHRSMCYASMGRTISGMNRGRPEEALKACQLITGHADLVQCIDAVAKDQLWDPSGQDAGIRFCSIVPAEDGQRECYLGLLYHAAFVLNAEQRASFCPQIPAALYDQCIRGQPAPSLVSSSPSS